MKSGLALIFFSLFLASDLSTRANDFPETRIKVAVLDTGLDISEKIRPFLCRSGHSSLVKGSDPFKDGYHSKHGSNVAGLIAENLDPKKQCLVIINFYDSMGPVSDYSKLIHKGVRHAIRIKADYLNMSLGGPQASKVEYALLRRALLQGMKVAVAAGNNSGKSLVLDSNRKVVVENDLQLFEDAAQDLDKECIYFPACYKMDSANFHVVGSNTTYKNKWGGDHVYGNFGSQVTHWENGTNRGLPAMTGTSQSTAIHMGKWAGGKLK